MDETALKPANENPWYVLMTLYGEQTGEEVNEELHEQNREVWNAWASSALSSDEGVQLARAGAALPESGIWKMGRKTIEAKHRAEMLRRNGKGAAYPGFPAADTPIDMSGAEFLHKVVFTRFLFARPADFEFTKFCGDAWFDAATFGGETRFVSATFSGKAQFFSATFCADALFSIAKFSGDARFDHATFSGKAQFFSPTFNGDASFDAATFSENAQFGAAIFNALTSFGSATFGGDAWFSGATFGGEARFFSVKFGGHAHFRAAEFGASVEFANGQFQKPTDFLQAKFSRYPDFSGTILHDLTTFSDEAACWTEASSGDSARAKACKDSCAVIRHNLGKQGLTEEEHFFYRREMGFAGQIGGRWQRLPYRAFGILSEYGYSIAKPAWWLLGLWVLAAMVNHVVLQWGASFGAVEDYHPVQAFGLSFANLFPIFGLHKLWFEPGFLTNLHWGLKALGGVETVASLFLLFFLGLGFRTRFRLR